MAAIFIFSTSTFNDRVTGSVLGRVLDLFWTGYTHRELMYINFLVRKSAHVAVYAVLALLWFRALAYGAGYDRKKAMLAALLIVTVVAASDEFHQSFVHGRTAKKSDVALDMLAGAIALTVLGPRIKIKAPLK
jgi:VanZ family protein